MKMRLLFTLLMLFISGNMLFAQTYFQPTNLDFEKGDPGNVPPGWDINKTSEDNGYSTYIDVTGPVSGKQIAKLKKEPDYDTSNDSLDFSGAIYQNIDGLPYRNYKIKFRAAVKTDLPGPSAKALLFIQSREEIGTQGNFVITEDNPIQTKEWEYFEITADIQSAAQQIKYGVILVGEGDVLIDDASVSIVQPEGSGLIPPKKLSPEDLVKLEALANMYGYARFFCPSDETKSTDWNRLMLKSVYEILNEDKPLKNQLTRLFKPVIPVFNITTAGEPHNIEIQKPKEALDGKALAWMHSGGFEPRSSKFFFSTVHNLYESLRPREAAAFQVQNISGHVGKELTVKVKAKNEPAGYSAGSQLWLRVDNERNQVLQTSKSHEVPQRNTEWQDYSASVQIPKSADIVRIGCVFKGEGSAYFDDVRAYVDGTEIKLRNPSFEQDDAGQRLSRGWLVPGTVFDAGYSVMITDKSKTKDEKSLIISSSSQNRINFPEIGEIFNLRLNDDLVLNMPSVLWADSTNSLPKTKFEHDYSIKGKPAGFFPVAEDRTSRLTIALMAWTSLNNFMIKDVPDELMHAEFEKVMKKAAIIETRDEMLSLLEKLLSVSNDSQARVWQGYKTDDYALPILLKVVNDTVFVTKVHNTVKNIEAGDKLIEIEGTPVMGYLADIASDLPVSNKGYGLKRAIAMMRIGKSGEPLSVKIKKANGKILDTVLKKSMNTGELQIKRLPKIYELEKGIVYIDLTAIKDKQLKNYIEALQEVEAIIFDTRGLVQTSVHLLGLFMDKPGFSVRWEIPVYTFPDKSRISYTNVKGIIKNHNKLQNKKLLFLCNETSMGYSEALLQLVKDFELGTVIGTKTAGMPGEIIPYRLPGAYNMSITAMKTYSPKGELISFKGVDPDIITEPDEKQIKAETDALIEKALELIK